MALTEWPNQSRSKSRPSDGKIMNILQGTRRNKCVSIFPFYNFTIFKDSLFITISNKSLLSRHFPSLTPTDQVLLPVYWSTLQAAILFIIFCNFCADSTVYCITIKSFCYYYHFWMPFCFCFPLNKCNVGRKGFKRFLTVSCF